MKRTLLAFDIIQDSIKIYVNLDKTIILKLSVQLEEEEEPEDDSSSEED